MIVQFTLKPTNAIKITTIDAWYGAFFIFMRIYQSANIDEILSLIKYIANVKLGVSRVSGGLGQRDYDRQFRLKKTKNNTIKLSRRCSFFTLLQMCIKKSRIPKAVQHFVMITITKVFVVYKTVNIKI